MEMHDETKVTHHYLESINRKYSLAMISEEERQAGMGIEASNNISESVHASSTHSLKMYGTIRLDSAAAEGQTRANNDFGRDYDALVHRKAKDPPVERDLGFFLRLHPKIQRAMIVVGKRMSKEMRRLHDDALKTSKEAKLNKMRIQQEKNAEAHGEMWIEAMNYIEQYSSSRCWKSHEQAIEEYNKLDSESKRLKAVKEQISIRQKVSDGRMRGTTGLKMDIPSHQESYLIISSTPFFRWNLTEKFQPSLNSRSLSSQIDSN
jgi:hypothetical protein